MVSYVTSQISRYYESSGIKKIVDTHPKLTKVIALTATTLAGLMIDSSVRQWLVEPRGNDVVCESRAPRCFSYRCHLDEESCSLGWKESYQSILEGPNNSTGVEKFVLSPEEDCRFFEPDCSIKGSSLDYLISGIKDVARKVPAVLIGAGAAGLLRVAKATVSKFDSFVFPSRASAGKEKALVAVTLNRSSPTKEWDVVSVSSKTPREDSSAWVKVAKGFAYYPLIRLAGLASVFAGSAAELIKPEIIKETFSLALPVNAGIPLIFYALSSSVAAEEFIFRTVIQELMMKRGVSAILKKFSPTLAEKNNNHPLAKAIRNVVSTSLFSLFHLPNAALIGMDNVAYQLANTFGGGIILGHLQEMTGSTWASIGAHLSMNALYTASCFSLPETS